MSPVEDFIYRHEGSQLELLQYFHGLLSEEFNLEPKIRFGIPFYYRKHWICYLNPVQPGKIELAFLRGNELSNIQGILESKKRKMVKGVEFLQMTNQGETLIREIIHEAILLDSEVPYSLKSRNHDKI